MENFKDWFRYPFQDNLHTSQPQSPPYIRIMDQQKEEIERLKEQVDVLIEQISGLKVRIQTLEDTNFYHPQLYSSRIRQSTSSHISAKLNNQKKQKRG